MRRHQFLGHIADVRLQVEGDTPQELFQAAVEGMADLMKTSFRARRGRNLRQKSPAADRFEEEISISSPDMTSLLLDFMAEVLTRSQIHRVIFYAVQFSEFKQTSLRAKIIGEKVAQWDKDIKAVTYHEAEIKKDKDGFYRTIVVFDI